MHVVITGGAGFIGSNLAMELHKHHEVTVIDDFSNSDFKNLIGLNGSVFAYDISDFNWEEFFKNKKIDIIFHEAAISDTTVMDQKRMMEVNVNSFKPMIEYAVRNKTKIIYASSAAVYGRGSNPMREDQDLVPLNVYGFSKYIMDNMAMEYASKFPDLKIIGLRYFNVFGPREAHKQRFASMIYQLSEQMKEGKKPRIFTDGEQTRDHIYIKDVIQANLKLMNYDKSGIFNVGTGKETTFNQIIKYLNETLNLNMDTEYFDNPYNFYQDKTCADISRLKKEVGYEPEYSVQEGIVDYLKPA